MEEQQCLGFVFRLAEGFLVCINNIKRRMKKDISDYPVNAARDFVGSILPLDFARNFTSEKFWILMYRTTVHKLFDLRSV